MKIHAKLLKDENGILEVVLYEEGKYSTPLYILQFVEFENLFEELEQVNNQSLQ